MALNFPGNTSQPYIDPVSGLKYIFNSSVGAWETAIQPPVIISDTPPSLEIPGFMWWDSIGGKLYVRYEDSNSKQWVDAVPAGDTFPGAVVSGYPPSPPFPGDIWLDISDPQNPTLKIYGVLNGTLQWIQVTYPNIPFSIPKISSATKPTFANENDIWLDTVNRTLNVFVGDSWVSAQSSAPQSENKNIIGLGAIHVSETDKLTLTVDIATTQTRGVTRFATQNEVNLSKLDNVAISPVTLRSGISLLAPDSSDSQRGMIRLATKEEAIDGTSEIRAVTPKTLNDKIKSLDFQNPVGTIINFAGSSAPDGYLECDGRIINRNDYLSLFRVIGTKYGMGDGIKTFGLPNQEEIYIGLEGSPQKTGVFIVCVKF